MASADRAGGGGGLRGLAGIVLGAALVAVVALPFVAGSWGPSAYRAPGVFNREAPPPPAWKEPVQGSAEPADLPGLKKRLSEDVDLLVRAGEEKGSDPLAVKASDTFSSQSPAPSCSRLAGSDGAAVAALIVEKRFREAGLANVCVQSFPVTVPVTVSSGLRVEGVTYGVKPLWPNAPRTCTIEGELSAPLVWGGDARLEQLDDEEVAGSILVLENDRGLDWVTACSLGARAVVFAEPESPADAELRTKVLTAAVDIPRFWLSRAESAVLVGALRKARAEERTLTGALRCRVDWRTRMARNVYGLMPGRDPGKARDLTVVSAHYDSTSLVPDLAPGAESAASMAALFELLARLRANPPARSVLFLASGAHYQGLLGETHAAELLRRPAGKLLEQLAELDGPVLNVRSQEVLMGAGLTVKGMAAWQRVLLIVLGVVLAAGTVVGLLTLRLSRGGKAVLAVAVIFVGGVGLAGMGLYFARERRATAAETARYTRSPWEAYGYATLRRELGKLRRVNAGLAGELMAVVERREAAEGSAILARARVQELWKPEAERQTELAREDKRRWKPPPEEWLGRFRQAAAELASAAQAAADFRWTGGAGENSGEPTPAAADYRELRRLVEAGSARRSRELEACRTLVADLEESQKNAYVNRSKYLRLAGYLETLSRLGPDLPGRVGSCVGLDLSSHTDRMAIFFKGGYVDQFIQKDVKVLQTLTNPVAEVLAASGSAYAAIQGWGSTEESPFVTDTTVALGGRQWTALAPGAPYFGTELFTLSGVPAITLGTAYDGRRLLDSPLDTPGRLDFDNLAKQTEVAARTLAELLTGAGAGQKGLALLESMEKQSDLKNTDSMLRVSGLVIEYNPAKSRTLSVTPVPGALVLSRREPEQREGRGSNVRPAYVPVRTFSAAVADEWGGYEFFGLPVAAMRAWNEKGQRLLAYELDAASGRIVKAPDDGEQGAKRGKPWREPKRNEDEFILTTFGCRALNLFEVCDLRSYESIDTQFNDVRMFLGKTDVVPISWGVSMAGETPAETYPEHAMVLFVEDRKDKGGKPVPINVKATFGRRRLAGVRWPMLAVPPESDRALQKQTHEGLGVPTGPSARLTAPPDFQRIVPAALLMAQDLYRLDDYRLYVLDRAGVRNASLVRQHADAGRALVEAARHRRDRNWDRMMAAARAAWENEGRGYPNIQGAVTDVVKGLLFYLFLMLPFAYFVERLLFAFPDINRQLAGVFGVFMATFAVLFVMHPAFKITSSAPMILLAFITMALAVLVISMISSRFKRELESLQARPGRSRKADMDRFNAALSAFLLGINNMRRRKVRTVLTLVTLVLLTFSVLSFSSIESTLGANRRVIAQDRAQPYDGVLVRNESWNPLDEIAYRRVRDEFEGRTGTVAPRAWMSGETWTANLSAAGSPENAFNVAGLLGVLAQESAVTGLGRAEMLVAGRWFRPEEAAAPVCVLSEGLMAKLKLEERIAEVRPEAPPEKLPQVVIFGERLAVIGVLADEPLRALKDVDGESPVPVDLSVEGWQRQSGRGAGSEALEFRQYTHLNPAEVPVVPYNWLMSRGGKLHSVALVPKDPAGAVPLAEDQLLRRVSVPMFVSSHRAVTFMSTAKSSDVSNMGSLLVPMIIAALIVLNTMLGAVYEREKEIAIYGALGLAPVHIGSLFIAESAVFAVVSAVLGYVLGQSVAKLVVVTGGAWILKDICLNYSSLSAVFSACFIIAVVMLSAAYPAFRAGRLSVPDVERIWKFPQPEGDRLVFDFPFTVSGEQALGVNMHLVHFFRDHANQSVGEFYTADTAFAYRGERRAEGGYRLTSRVWIAPFDFGISQRLVLETFLAADEKNIYETRMVLERVSGSPEAWVKMNHRFMKGIRKQFLLWRLFTVEERSWHVAQARALLGEGPPVELGPGAGAERPPAGAPSPEAG